MLRCRSDYAILMPVNNALLVAILAGLGGMLGWGFSEFATKKSVDKIGAISSLVWAHVFGTIILFFILFVRWSYGPDVPLIASFRPGEWIGFLIFGALQTVVYYFSYKGFEKGNVSVLSPIFASFAGLVALFSVLVFGEIVSGGLVLALILIFGGVILINLDIKGLRSSRVRIQAVPGLKEIIIATLLATVWTLGWNKFTENKDWMVYTTLMFAWMTVSAYVIARFKKVDLGKVRADAWKFLWLIAIGEVVAYLAITLGYASTRHASVVAVLSGASSLPTIVLARIFLKERLTTTQAIASIIIIAGIVVLSLH